MDQQQALKIIVKAQDDASATLKTIQNEAKKTGEAVNQASKDGGAAMEDFRGKLGGIVDTLKTVAVTAGVAAIGFGAMFVHSAADLQQTSQSMQVLTGNTQVANKLFGQLATYANNTPFEFPQIAKAGQTLLGFGISSDKVYDDIKMLGDISAATGADLGSLSLVFSQVNATGKLMGQDALQLINNQIPIFNILGKKMGLTAGQVKQKMEEGAISADIFNQALQDVTKQGGFAFQGTAKLAQTFNGRMSTLSDTFLEFGRNLLGVKVTSEGLQIDPNGVFQKLSDALLTVTKNLQKYTPQAQAAFGWLIDHAGTIAQAVVAISAAFVAFKIASFVGSAVAAVQAAGGLGAAFMILAGGPVGLIALAIAALVAGLVFLQLKFDIVGKSISFVKGVIDGINPAIDTAKQFLAGLAKDGLDVAKAALDTFNGAIQASKQFIIDHKNEIITAAAVLATLFGPTLIMLGVQALVAGGQIAAGAVVAGAAWVKQAALSAAAWVANLPSVIANSVVAGAQSAASAVVAGAAWTVQAVKSAASWVANFVIMKAQAVIAGATMVAQAALAGYAWIARGVAVAIPWIIAFGSMVVGAIAAGISIAAAGIAAAIPWLIAFAPVILIIAAVAAAAWLIVSNWGVITQFMSGLWQGVQNFIGGFIDWIKSNWPLLLAIITGPIGLAVLFIIQHWQQIKDGAASMINGLIGFFGGLPGRVMGAIGSFGNLLYNSGRDLINGLLNGAGSLLSNIGNFFLDKVPGWIKDPFKKALGIHSPSKVFASFGKFLIQGLTNGIDSSAGMIKSAMGSVSNAVSTGLSVSASPTVTANISGQSGNIDVSASTGGSSAPNVQSSSDAAPTASQAPIIFQPTFNGPIIGTDSGLRELSVTMAKMLQDALKAQGTTDVNMLRSNG